ncbi:MAG: hypothetical protein RLZ10_514 [Bacteroidota bacterium]|jgi:hypothetical protein
MNILQTQEISMYFLFKTYHKIKSKNQFNFGIFTNFVK